MPRAYSITVGTIAPTVPNAPTIGTATAGDGTASVAFTAPASNGVTVTGYRVTRNPGGATQTGTSSPISIASANGVAATFTVAANSAGGYGPESAASNSVTPAAAGGGAFTDTFERADGAVGNGWTVSPDNAAVTLLNGRVKNSGTQTTSSIVRELGANGEIDMTGYAGTDGVSTSSNAQPYIRFRQVDENNYLFADHSRLYQMVAGVQSGVGDAVSNPTGTSPWATRVTFNGTAIKVYSDGVLMAQWTSSQFQTATKGGLAFNNETGQSAGDFTFTPA